MLEIFSFVPEFQSYWQPSDLTMSTLAEDALPGMRFSHCLQEGFLCDQEEKRPGVTRTSQQVPEISQAASFTPSGAQGLLGRTLLVASSTLAVGEQHSVYSGGRRGLLSSPSAPGLGLKT